MRLTDEGQVTLPKQVIEALELSPGDDVVFGIDDAGRVTLTRQTAVERFDEALRRIKADPPIKGVKTDEITARLRGDDETEAYRAQIEAVRKRRPIRDMSTDEIMHILRDDV